MQRMWSWLGLNLGKHAGVVSVVGLLITLILGFGATRLDFATGQDSYLNKSDQVYKDNVRYQDLFGGEAMVTLFTMDPGKTVVDLFTPANITHMRQVDTDLHNSEGITTVITPLTALQFTQNLVTGPPSNPNDVTASVAGKALLSAQSRDPSAAGQAARAAD